MIRTRLLFCFEHGHLGQHYTGKFTQKIYDTRAPILYNSQLWHILPWHCVLAIKPFAKNNGLADSINFFRTGMGFPSSDNMIGPTLISTQREACSKVNRSSATFEYAEINRQLKRCLAAFQRRCACVFDDF